MRNYRYLRNAASLGTLTALFLLVRCTVAERDYSELGIGGNSGGGGSSGDGMGGTSAGQGGGDGLGGQDAGPTVEPIPCVDVGIDAGSSTDAGDAGSTDAGDAGSTDAGSTDADANRPTCACVDGFIQAVDADGDGAGTRECLLAPGLDCDDGDGAVTHNSCGGCNELPNTLGEDCLECGVYTCDGPEAVVCGTRPDYTIVDPDCRCEAGLIVARDTDGDGEGTRLCEENPGSDCNDGDETYVTNACGGCSELPGTVGAPCNECGVYACNGTALACVPPSGAAGRRCVDGNTRQACVGTGFWDLPVDCTNVCYQGNCETCTPGTFQCYYYGTGDAIYQCITNASIGSSSYGIGWASYGSCSGATPRCNPTNGSCTTGYLLVPRDRTFDVVPLLERGGLPWHDVLNTASDSDYG